MTALCSWFPLGITSGARHWQSKKNSKNRRGSPFSMAVKAILVVLLLMCMVCYTTAADSKVQAAAQEAIKTNAADAPKDAPKDDPKGPVDKENIIKKDPYGKLVDDKKLVDLGFIHACVASFSVIIVSEIGDKTFFITAIMSMRHSRLTVFLGAMGALIFMTILSACMGFATTVIPRWLTYYCSSVLFAVFGIRMIRDSLKMTGDEGQEEYEEVQQELRKKDEDRVKAGVQDPESGIIHAPKRFLESIFSRVFLQAFTLNVLAEWGDRSQIATIILAAREEVLGVILGGIVGHTICTSLAVVGGRFISSRISARTVTLIGGIVFIIFALSAFVIEPDD